MIRITFFLCFILVLLKINGEFQINMHLTDWKNDKDLRYDCLYAVTAFNRADIVDIITSYCMTEWPSKWQIKENDIDNRFNFEDLSKQGITTEQLYHWSAPIDTIENYQLYLDKKLNDSENISMEFYNCTFPYFGSKCQYILNNDKNSRYSSFNEFVHSYYYHNRYVPSTFTCYTHLQCNRGPSPSCLDWTEICDGKNDCLDGEQDEENCGLLEITRDVSNEFDSGFHYQENYGRHGPTVEPTILSEDITCQYMSTLTSSCVDERNKLLLKAMFSIQPNSLSNECWTALKYMINAPIANNVLQSVFCTERIAVDVIQQTCPDMIHTTAVPILFGHVYLIYRKSNFNYDWYERYFSLYVSYDHRKLQIPDDGYIISVFDNLTYRSYAYSIFSYDKVFIGKLDTYIPPLRRWLSMSTYFISNSSIYCNQSYHMYQCTSSSKCISQTRFLDGIRDCYSNDDENKHFFNGYCSSKWNYPIFQCRHTNACIAFRFLHDTQCDCPVDQYGNCADEFVDNSHMKYEILFRRICDNFTGLYPIMIDGQSHTDETDCEQWPCNNIYTRCDGIWNCDDGIDEIDCHSSSIIPCPSNNHLCLSSKTLEYICLPLDKVNDNQIDCIGGADESRLCPANTYGNMLKRFHCQNNNSTVCLEGTRLCDNIVDCTNEEDERNCTYEDKNNYDNYFGICRGTYETYRSNISKVFCPMYYQNDRMLSRLYFKDFRTSDGLLVENTNTNTNNEQNSDIKYEQQRCHRGLDIQISLDKTRHRTTNACLCPPSFYGDTCQYQNQRVVIILEIFAMPDSLQTSFIISLSLIDDSNERTIHSNEQIIFFAQKSCFSKFYIYLLYSSRPKNSTKQYSIHIDIYDRKTLTYRGSILKSILFSFLPVYRLSFQLHIPSIRSIDRSSCSDSQCIHGQCRRYFNTTHNATFCQCHQGWSGRYCTIQHACTCSFDSLCIGQLANNRSICICPLNRMGPRCLLEDFICQNKYEQKCLNGGECIRLNDHDKQFTCRCPKTYMGNRCERNQTKIILSFSKDIIVPPAIRIHFIFEADFIVNSPKTIYKTISSAYDSTMIYYSSTFTIVFFEWSKNYYLPLFYNQFQQSVVIQKQIHASDRCAHINELFNQTILSYPRIRRIKYYHVPCRTVNLLCFYDENYFCLCLEYAGQRLVHCIEFNHNVRYDCKGKNVCENGGECYQDEEYCPTTSLCVCQTCFYGTQCQLNTNEYSLSLDTILGYHIRPLIDISQQNSAVLISIVLSVIISLIGIINSILTFLTFKQKQARDLGCGIYLYCTSFNSLFIIILLMLKIWILVLSHIGSIQNRLFLMIQCYSLDYLLRVCLTLDHWLTACVAIERAYIILQRTHFDRNKTKNIAKKVIIALLLLILSTNIQDPLNRRLFDEENDEEKRIWCIVSYIPIVYVLDSIITTVYIICPFIINFISTVTIIIASARQRKLIQKQKKYQTILFEQFRQHKNLLIAPIVLILLDIPRLIITFVPGCLKSSSDSWLFLIGYFLSFIPSLLTFILFVLPSTSYSQLFNQAIRRYVCIRN